MIIKSLQLVNFRNYENSTIHFSDKLNIIYGENAQGKTNILEAIFLCSAGRSHRTSKDKELIKYLEKFYKVNIITEYESRNQKEIEILYDGSKKKLRLNEVLQNKIGNLMGNLLVVLFSPESLSLIKEGPSERRRFIDIGLSQIKPIYFHYLQDYNKILKNRNKLLKDQQDLSKLRDFIGVWNEQLADYGAKITLHRNKFLTNIEKYAKTKHNIISGGKEEIKIKYKSSIAEPDLENYVNIKKKYLNRLDYSLKNDMIRCSTSYGPHRDDFEIFINDKNTKQFASQGQQRSAILAIKLAELEIMKSETETYPVLLLDDVMSELDKNRQEFLLGQIDEIQTFITVTDKDIFKEKNFKNVSFIEISQGNVIE